MRGLVALLLIASLAACQSNDESEGDDGSAPPVVDVTMLNYAFQAPDSIPSGWTSFRVTNEGEEHHLFLLEHLPAGITYADFQDQVTARYDSLRSLLRAGSIDETTYRNALLRAVPNWYLNRMEAMGGVSLTAPGRTATTTFNVEPGTYAMLCYARTPEGRFHFLRGMLQPLIVTTDSTNARPPEADLSVALSDLKIQADSMVSPGPHTIAVRFGDKRKGGAYGYWFQHLYLAQLDRTTGAQSLAQWMKGNPIMPAPVEFLGGVQDMPAGHTAYVQVDLSPGRYAWVLGNPPKQGEVTPFTVE